MGDNIKVGDIVNSIGVAIGKGARATVNIFRDPADERRLRNRQAMLKLVHDFWIEGVLHQSLHNRVLIQITLTARQEAVQRPWNRLLHTPQRPNQILPPEMRMIEIFDEMARSLLILGAPGAGKTTALLELARDAIERAQRDITQPIPVIFNLSSWASKRQPLDKWLVAELRLRYQIPKRVAQMWVAGDDLLLLLDGLDEVHASVREACLHAINRFLQERLTLVPIAICSRTEEYEALTAQLALHNAVVLHPLQPEQIDAYLNKVQADYAVIGQIIANDADLRELARSPLMLNIMLLAYGGSDAQEVHLLESLPTPRQHLFDTYIKRMFQRRAIRQPYPPEQTMVWLSWLARRMVAHEQSILFLEQIQPSWLSAAQSTTYFWRIPLTVLALALLVFLYFFLGHGITIDPDEEYSPIGALLIELLTVGTIAVLPVRILLIGRIDPVEGVRWSWQQALSGGVAGFVFAIIVWVWGILSESPILRFIRILGYTIFWSLLWSLGFSIVVAFLLSAFNGGPQFIRLQRHLSTSRLLKLGSVVGLMVGIGVGISDVRQNQRLLSLTWFWLQKDLPTQLLNFSVPLIMFLIFAGIGMIMNGAMNPVPIELKTTPNQGITRSGRNALRVFLLAEIVISLVGVAIGWGTGVGSELFSSSQVAVSLALIPATILALLFGGVAYLRHYGLRFFLYCFAVLPWQLPKFLDFAVERVLLYRIGGGYMFIHRQILEHFAQMFPTIAEDVPAPARPSLVLLRKAIVALALLLFAAMVIAGYPTAKRNFGLYWHRQQASIYMGENQLNKAIDEFNQMIALDPGVVDAYFNRAIAHARNGNLQAAIADYSKTISLEPDSNNAYLYRGDLFNQLGQYEKAIADYSHAISIDPGYDRPFFNRGLTYTWIGEFAKAIADFDVVTSMYPSKPDSYIYRGMAYLSWGKADRALTEFETVINSHPQEAMAYLGRASVHEWNKQTAEAAQDYWQWLILYARRDFIPMKQLEPGDTLIVDVEPGLVYQIPFMGTAEHYLTVSADQQSSHEQVDPLLLLLDSNKRPLIGNNNVAAPQNLNAAIVGHPLPATGLYTVVLGQGLAAGTGQVKLHVTLDNVKSP